MTVYAVRHAKAGSRSSHDPDERRPLTEKGREQAEHIADVLEAAGIARILSSRYTRCVQTVEPLATRLGVSIEIHPALAEEAGIEDAWDLLEALSDTTAVVCSHGNILSPILDRVHRRGAEIEAAEWSCHKGSVWRLEPDDDRPFARAVLDVVQA